MNCLYATRIYRCDKLQLLRCPVFLGAEKTKLPADLCSQKKGKFSGQLYQIEMKYIWRSQVDVNASSRSLLMAFFQNCLIFDEYGSEVFVPDNHSDKGSRFLGAYAGKGENGFMAVQCW